MPTEVIRQALASQCLNDLNDFPHGQFFAGGEGGGGEPFTQKFSEVAQIFTKHSKTKEGHMMHQLRTTNEVKIFLPINLSFELIKHIKRNSQIDGQIYLCSFRLPNVSMEPLNDR